ncbi:secretin and TonB N-terminal domain-containing protein [Bradyrhizobium sp. 2TAF24]|uniref:secretin and TonB N-terminal domain-containing protein n=1 Tax=Bradyrhizobium sp. 2TAF24 TaxID=3233011 RepID=UPI003F8FA13D
MTVSAAPRLSLWQGVLAALLLLIAMPALAVERSTASGDSTVYDIPAQDLARALNAYATASGLQVLYETALAAGRSSTAVKGRMTPDAALQLLLSGSGLVSRRTDVDAITLYAEKPPDAAPAPARPDPRFLGVLQGAVLGALCGTEETRPGTYRAALQLWITPAGAITRAALLGSTGDVRRDAALQRLLPGTVVGAPPPGLGQPVTLVIGPRAGGARPECG